jgi:glycosyltransferase involved in cell wall biosynthesis
MHFSVIIPLFNKEKYILRAIDSVLRQSHGNFELIIVDDGSTDSSAEAVQSISDSRIRLIQRQNGGESAARNTGINVANHPYIAFLDADDAWEADYLETIAGLIKDFPAAGIYCTGYHVVEKEARKKFPNWVRVPQRGRVERYFYSVARGDQIATSSSVCIPAKIFEAVGSFSLGDKLGADQDMWARIALDYDVVVDAKACATYFKDADNRVCATESHASELPYSVRLQEVLNGEILREDLAVDIKDYITSGLVTLVSVNLRSGKKVPARALLRDNRLRQLKPRILFWRILANLPGRLSTGVLSVAEVARATLNPVRTIFTTGWQRPR